MKPMLVSRPSTTLRMTSPRSGYRDADADLTRSSARLFTDTSTVNTASGGSTRMVAERVSWAGVRKIGARLTTPLHPDDYLSLINPLWTARELRGRIEEVIPETEDAATIVIRPGWGWHYQHRPGQYVGIGVQVDGKFQWRVCSVGHPPPRRPPGLARPDRRRPGGARCRRS